MQLCVGFFLLFFWYDFLHAKELEYQPDMGPIYKHSQGDLYEKLRKTPVRKVSDRHIDNQNCPTSVWMIRL